MLFRTSFHILVLKIPVNVSFYRLSTSGFTTEPSLNEKISFTRSGEKTFKKF